MSVHAAYRKGRSVGPMSTVLPIAHGDMDDVTPARTGEYCAVGVSVVAQLSLPECATTDTWPMAAAWGLGPVCACRSCDAFTIRASMSSPHASASTSITYHTVNPPPLHFRRHNLPHLPMHISPKPTTMLEARPCDAVDLCCQLPGMTALALLLGGGRLLECSARFRQGKLSVPSARTCALLTRVKPASYPVRAPPAPPSLPAVGVPLPRL